jgi:hypothetical protein
MIDYPTLPYCAICGADASEGLAVANLGEQVGRLFCSIACLKASLAEHERLERCSDKHRDMLQEAGTGSQEPAGGAIDEEAESGAAETDEGPPRPRPQPGPDASCARGEPFWDPADCGVESDR